ncbi:hypothetical protein BDQ17DRAFT_1425034 [Cyathus striatus]|nr:hypothetical protein BDQ17DRAFT_1425034 [Cyathus striatus]
MLGAMVYGGENYTLVNEWHSFMGGNQICLNACDPSDSDDDRPYCQRIFDRIGCAYNVSKNAKTSLPYPELTGATGDPANVTPTNSATGLSSVVTGSIMGGEAAVKTTAIIGGDTIGTAENAERRAMTRRR